MMLRCDHEWRRMVHTTITLLLHPLKAEQTLSEVQAKTDKLYHLPTNLKTYDGSITLTFATVAKYVALEHVTGNVVLGSERLTNQIKDLRGIFPSLRSIGGALIIADDSYFVTLVRGLHI